MNKPQDTIDTLIVLAAVFAATFIGAVLALADFMR